MSQTKEQIEQELQSFKDANPSWMSDAEKRQFVASYNNRLASFSSCSSITSDQMAAISRQVAVLERRLSGLPQPSKFPSIISVQFLILNFLSLSILAGSPAGK